MPGPGTPAWKQVLAWALRRPPGSWLLHAAHRFLPAFQPIGVLAVILDPEGRVLLLDHVTRAEFPLGLPGGWLNRAERPEDGLRRELHEELGVEVASSRYLLSVPHRNGDGQPYGLTLVFAVELAPGAAGHLSAEILGSAWLPPGEASSTLRDFEAQAVRLAASPPPAHPV
ncbi:MAG: NUDIX hydrolase [Dehalococcoidia bacterium]